ncbi:MAG: ADP-glyceromanno-heptose 6-epimerase [Bacteroidales bacterium]|nr:ADP-glyceromanno-heptose 6-epimerase [Bacteroidales bacterium]
MIAITGAAGFIGSNLAHRLADEHLDLLLVDSQLSPANALNFADLSSFRYLQHDKFISQLESGRVNPDVIFHLGACSSTTEKDWSYLESNNIDYTRRLWTWCQWRERPFIYASSAATYGDGSRGFNDRTHPAELSPLNLYGKSKNDFDLWALNQHSQGNMPPRWAGLKFFNVYGPRETHKGRMASMVYHCREQILDCNRVRLFKSNDPRFSDGGQLRDFVHVGDCVEHMIWLWRHQHPGGLYNSGTGSPRSFHDLANAVFASMGREPVIDYISMPNDLVMQYQNYTCADMTKLQNAGCGVLPTPLELGVRETVRFLESPSRLSSYSSGSYVVPTRKTA